MQFVKQHLGYLPYCYAVSNMVIDGEEIHLFAPDDIGPCIAIHAKTLKPVRVWEAPSGTMSIVPLEGRNGEFLASQRFLPGFRARSAEIVHMRYRDGQWERLPWLKLPYVHRFDIIEHAGRTWFLGCILSGTEREHADWSNPGRLIVAQLGRDMQPPERFVTIAEGMHRNHGYCRTTLGDEEWILTACDEGVFRVVPPEDDRQPWKTIRLMDAPASDVAVCDLDGDGKPELVVISPFHGDEVGIYREDGGAYACAFRVKHNSAFLHAIWAGTLNGQNVALIGGRGGDRETLSIQWKDGAYCTSVIEKGYGASNLFVVGSRVLMANREAGECAMLTASDAE